jgi:hypothetical protein
MSRLRSNSCELLMCRQNLNQQLKGAAQGGSQGVVWNVRVYHSLSNTARLSLLQIGAYEACLGLLVFLMHDNMKSDLNIKLQLKIDTWSIILIPRAMWDLIVYAVAIWGYGVRWLKSVHKRCFKSITFCTFQWLYLLQRWYLLRYWSDSLFLWNPKPITVTAQFEAWTVFVRSNTGIMVRIPQDPWMFVCVCVVLNVGSGLETNWSPILGVYRIKKLKERRRPNSGM